MTEIPPYAYESWKRKYLEEIRNELPTYPWNKIQQAAEKAGCDSNLASNVADEVIKVLP